MSVKIRLARYGSKKSPYYRIVVASTEAPRDGRFLEFVGTYDPLKDHAEVTLKHERVKNWIEKGAVPSATVKNILKSEGYFSETANA